MSTSTKGLIGLLIAGTVGFVIFLFVGLSSNKDGSPKLELGTKKAAAACVKGSSNCLPDVNYTDTSGKAYTVQSLAGKVVVVNFWATWCRPCQREIPDLSKAYDKYKNKGVVFLGVMTDNADDQSLLNFQSDHEMTYPVVRGSSDILVAYNYPESLPTTFIFDRGGKQIFSKVGGISAEEIDDLIGRL